MRSGRTTTAERVKIYGTDVDEDALATRGAAVYTAKDVESVPDELRDALLRARRRGATRSASDLRRTVIFGRNNLLEDAPISRLDLLAVPQHADVLHGARARSAILRHFHFALAEGGALMLGKSEMMLSHRDAFAADRPQAADLPPRRRPASLRSRVADLAAARPPRPRLWPRTSGCSRDVALEVGPQPQLLVSRAGVLTFANLAARALFGIPVEASGGRSGTSSSPPARPTCAPRSRRRVRERRRVSLGEVRFTPDKGDERRLDVTVSPLLPTRRRRRTARRSFQRRRRATGARARARGQPPRPPARLRGAAVDDRRARDDQRGAAVGQRGAADDQRGAPVDQRGARDDERGAPVDQRGARDHQRRAARPHRRAQPLQRLPRDDPHLARARPSRSWTATTACTSGTSRAEDLWGLRQDEAVGQHFLALDIGLPTERLAPVLRGVLGGTGEARAEIELEAVNRRGRAITCSATVMAFADGTTATARPAERSC